MSWLYTIVFAGLMFASQNGTASNTADKTSLANTATEAARQDETERFEQSYPLNSSGRVSVSNVNGSIIVEAWDKNEVKLEAVKIADSKETLSEVQLRIDSTPDSFSVATDYDDWKMKNKGEWGRNRRLEVQFSLFVPRGAVLNEVETVNGSVTVSDFTNYTKVSAVNGDVKVANLRGTANLSTVNGGVTADFDRLVAGSRISLSTVNGHVNLVIPSDSSAVLKADSVNGNISNDFGLPVRKGQYVGRDLYGRIGSGEVSIKLSSVNGPLAIGRKNDGKTPGPATNLLPQKSRDEQDWNDQDSETSVVDTEKLNKEVAKAVKESQKVTAIALKDAQKEITKIKPEIAKIDAEELKKAISSADLQARIADGIAAQQAALARLRDTNFITALPRIEKKSASFDVKGVPKVTIDAVGCSVWVRGWDKPTVKYAVTQFSDSRKKEALQMNESHSDSLVNIRIVNSDENAQNGNFFNDLRRVRIEVFVPRKTNLKINSNAEIRLEGVSGEIELTGGDESINVRDADGNLRLTNENGLVRLIGFRGALDATTSDGDLFLEGDFEKISTNAGDGTIVLTVPENMNASIRSNTDVEAEGVQIITDGKNVWRIGKGGPKYSFTFGEGKLIVRNLSQITTY